MLGVGVCQTHPQGFIFLTRLTADPDEHTCIAWEIAWGILQVLGPNVTAGETLSATTMNTDVPNHILMKWDVPFHFKSGERVKEEMKKDTKQL